MKISKERLKQLVENKLVEVGRTDCLAKPMLLTTGQMVESIKPGEIAVQFVESREEREKQINEIGKTLCDYVFLSECGFLMGARYDADYKHGIYIGNVIIYNNDDVQSKHIIIKVKPVDFIREIGEGECNGVLEKNI